MESFILLVIALSLALGVGCLGRSRKIGFGLAFVISLQCRYRFDSSVMLQENRKC